MFQKLSALTLLAASLGFAASANADTGLYVGGSVGQTTVEASQNAGTAGTLHFDEDDTSYKLFVGYMVLPFVGFEGGYTNLGNPSKNFSGANAEFEVDAWEAFVIGVLPLGPVDLFAKVGGASINVDAKLRVAGSTRDLRFRQRRESRLRCRRSVRSRWNQNPCGVHGVRRRQRHRRSVHGIGRFDLPVLDSGRARCYRAQSR